MLIPVWMRAAAAGAAVLVILTLMWIYYPGPRSSPTTQHTENVAREAVENANTARQEATAEQEKADAIEPQIQERRTERRRVRRTTAQRVEEARSVPDADVPDRIRVQRERTDAAIRAAHERRATEAPVDPD